MASFFPISEHNRRQLEALWREVRLPRRWIFNWLRSIHGRGMPFCCWPREMPLEKLSSEQKQGFYRVLRVGPRSEAPGDFLVFGDDLYPDFLAQLEDPPCVLYYSGKISVLSHSGPRITVVGTRHCSYEARDSCEKLIAQLAPYDPLIVSGMASGIDGVAHRAALRHSLKTLAVLGTPLDQPYPRSHRGLFREIVQQGLVVSELYPGAASGVWRFPERNRILAAWGEVIVVVEAPEKSGTLLTAQEALELGRDIFVIPGDWIRSKNQGGHRLVNQGALLLTEVEEMLSLLAKGGRGVEAASPRVSSGEENLSPEQQEIMNLLQGGSAFIDKICSLSKLPAPEVISAVTHLVLVGLIEELPGGELRRLKSFGDNLKT